MEVNNSGENCLNSTQIGARLKALRKKNKASLKTLASELGMSYSYLWGLENDKHSISIVNLQKICSYFQIDLIYFFSKDNLSSGVKLIKSTETIKYRTEDGLRFEVLSSSVSNRMEITLISHPAFSPAERRIYNHQIDGEEFITVIEGVLFVQISGINNYKLEKGDSICFDCRLDHSMYTEEQPAKFYLISSPPYNKAALI